MGAAEKYLLEELTEDQRSQYEEHFFDCRECAADVESGAAFVDNAKAVFSEPQNERVRVAVAEKPAPGWRALFWPVPAGAAAALALLLGGPAAYLAFHELPRLRSALAAAEALQPVSWHFLSVARSEGETVEVTRGTRMVGLTLSRSSGRTFPHYRCEVTEAGGRSVLSSVVPAPPAGDELRILIPVSRLGPGRYVLVLAGLESPSGSSVAPDHARYPFTLELEEE